jgi:spore maturation protein CgeB
MLILYAATRHDYGRPELGLSFEHFNFFESLRALGHDMIYLDTMGVSAAAGPAGLSARLMDLVKQHQPRLLFTSLLRDELDPQAIAEISRGGRTLTLNWFCDDHWRFESFSQHWAPRFNFIVTTAHSAVPKYRAIGYGNAIHAQWACNPTIYRRLDLPLTMAVSFVGQPHGTRRSIVEQLAGQGIDVQTFGRGWDHGRVSQERMVEIFNQSRINLNFANPIEGAGQSPTKLGALAQKLLPRPLLESAPFAAAVRGVGRVRRMLQPPAPATDATPAPQPEKQIKGRTFEVPGCGGLLLTERVEHLDEYYELGREIVCFDSTEDLADRIRWLLQHESEREAIADAGYQRTLRDHTYERRYELIFSRMGLPLHGDSATPRILEVFA